MRNMKAFWISFRNEYKIVTQVKKHSLKLSITATTFYGFWARLCVWTKFLHLNDFSLAGFFFFTFSFFFHIKKSKKKWYAYLHYYDNQILFKPLQSAWQSENSIVQWLLSLCFINISTFKWQKLHTMNVTEDLRHPKEYFV